MFLIDTLHVHRFVFIISILNVGFINLGSLVDRLPRKGSAQADSAQLMGRPKSLKQQARRAVQSLTERSSRGGAAPVFS